MRGTRRFGLWTLGLAVAAAGATSCGGDDEEPAPTDNAVVMAQALTGPVKEALDNPTGIVNAETAQAVLRAAQADATASAASAYVPGGAPPGMGPQNENPMACISYDAMGGVMDMACLTGGELTGFMTFSGGQQGDVAYVYYRYQNVCVPAADTCLDGQGASEVAGVYGAVQTVITAGDFDITEGAETLHVDYGYRVVMEGDSITIEYVAFVDGESFVMSASTDGTSGSFTVCGSNGCFSCTYVDEGASGQCSSSSGDSFSW